MSTSRIYQISYRQSCMYSVRSLLRECRHLIMINSPKRAFFLLISYFLQSYDELHVAASHRQLSVDVYIVHSSSARQRPNQRAIPYFPASICHLLLQNAGQFVKVNTETTICRHDSFLKPRYYYTQMFRMLNPQRTSSSPA